MAAYYALPWSVCLKPLNNNVLGLANYKKAGYSAGFLLELALFYNCLLSLSVLSIRAVVLLSVAGVAEFTIAPDKHKPLADAAVLLTRAQKAGQFCWHLAR